MQHNTVGTVIPEEENVLAGIVGAFLFSLVGGILWFVLYQVGLLAGISGLVGAICAIKGYGLFAKRESKKGVIIAVVMALLVMVIAWYFCLSYDVYVSYQEMFKSGEIDFSLTFFESVRAAYLFLSEPEVAAACFKDLAIGLVLCVVGGGRSVVAAFRNAGEPATQVPHVEVYPPAADDEAVGEESVAVSKEQEEVAH